MILIFAYTTKYFITKEMVNLQYINIQKIFFPPTDFHAAVLVNEFIYIIGNLGYSAERAYGTTPVYRLDINSFEIQYIETNGECPGWIYKSLGKFKSSINYKNSGRGNTRKNRG